MFDVDNIIQVLDESMMSSGKSYLTLQQCNKILLEKGIFQPIDISNKVLKHLLEDHQIPNAYQTRHIPKQWRVVKSENRTDLEVLYDVIESDSSDRLINDENVKEHRIYCPICGKDLSGKDLNINEDEFKCSDCQTVFSNPFKKKDLTFNSNSDIAKHLFEKYGLRFVIIAGIIIFLSILYFKIHSTKDYYNGGLTSEEKEKVDRINKLKEFASDVFRENSWCYDQWIVFSRLQQVDDKNYKDVDFHIDFQAKNLDKGEILLYTNKIIVPTPNENAIKDPRYGYPLSFYYQFFFNKADSLYQKNLVVVYYSDSIVKYNFKILPVQLIINKPVATKKNTEWERMRAKLAAQQKRAKQKNECQTTYESKPPTKVTKKFFKFKSDNYDIEKPDESGYKTVYSPSFHTVDFNNLIVKQKSLLNNQWVEIIYPIRSFYIDPGSVTTTYVIVVQSNGLKEVWFCPETESLGYDFLDGTRIACYDLTVLN